MNWEQYKALCDRGDVLSRFLLEETLQLLLTAQAGHAAAELRAALAGVPLPVPPDFKGGAAADCFRVQLTVATIDCVLAHVRAAQDAGARTSGGRHLGGFVEAWQECRDWVSGEHPRSPYRVRHEPARRS